MITHRRGEATCFAVLVAQNAHHLQIFAPIMAIRSMTPLNRYGDTDTVDIEELIKEYFHGGYSYIPSLVCAGPEQSMKINDQKISR